jgi:hypothetical protein
VINHSRDAVRVSAFVARVLVDEARGNTHAFGVGEFENRFAFYNFDASKTWPNFIQTYFFTPQQLDALEAAAAASPLAAA